MAHVSNEDLRGFSVDKQLKILGENSEKQQNLLECIKEDVEIIKTEISGFASACELKQERLRKEMVISRLKSLVLNLSVAALAGAAGGYTAVATKLIK